MKKLIEELEAAETDTKYLYDDAYTFAAGENAGIDTAIAIVRAHNPWHEATELPERCEKSDDCSINVLVTDGKSRNFGFYDFAECVWYMGKGYAIVTHWAYLPEVKP